MNVVVVYASQNNVDDFHFVFFHYAGESVAVDTNDKDVVEIKEFGVFFFVVFYPAALLVPQFTVVEKAVFWVGVVGGG